MATTQSPAGRSTGSHDQGFRQARFRDLPARPRRPHRYFDIPATDIEMDSQVFGRLRIRYRATGTGPPLLLVHGLMTTAYSWRYVLDGLAAHFRVIAVDLPGCGASQAPRGAALRSAALGVWLGEFQRELGIEGCAVVGNSLGGLPVLHHALDDPTAFNAVVIVHSPLSPQFRHRALAAALALPGVPAGLAAYIRRSPHRWAHYRTHYFDETLKSLEEAGEYGSPLATRSGSRAFIGHVRGGLRPRDMSALCRRVRRQREFPVPLLAVYGTENDPTVPPHTADTFTALQPAASLLRVDRASHFVHVDRPDAIIQAVTDFLHR